MRTIADELFREFREHSVSEFFRRNAAMLGYTGKIRSLTTVVHEGITNSIDSAEEMGVLPEIFVAIKRINDEPEHFRVVIEDNASGIPEEFIPNVFGKMLAGTRLHRNMQARGQQGIGVSGSVMFGQTTSGKPATIVTSTGDGEIIREDVTIDVDRNEGKITNSEKLKGKWRGTRAELEVKDVAYMRSRYGPFNYLRMTAIANPHVQITFIEPDGTLTIFERATHEVPDKPKPMPLHPWGILSDDLLMLAKHTKARTIVTFLSTELSRVSESKAKQVCKLARVPLEKYVFSWGRVPGNDDGMLRSFLKEKFGASWVENAELKKIDDEAIMLSLGRNSAKILLGKERDKATVKLGSSTTWKLKVKEEKGELNIYSERRPSDLTWEEAERMVSAFKQIKLMAPPTAGLRPIGAMNIENGMRQILKPDFAYVVTRPPKVYRGGLPFVTEVGIAHGGGAGKTVGGKGEAEAGEPEAGMELIRFANRAPLIFDQGGCVITSAARSINWRRYGVDISTSPLTLFVNVISAYVPYTSAGKQSIAEVPEIFEEIRGAIMEAARELRSFLFRKIRIKERQERAGVFEQYLPVVARKAAGLAGVREPDIKPLLKKVTGVEGAEGS